MTEVENAPTRNPTSDLGLPSCYMTVTTWMWDETDYMDVVDEMKCSCQNSEFLFRLCFFQAGRLAVFWVLVGFVACKAAAAAGGNCAAAPLFAAPRSISPA